MAEIEEKVFHYFRKFSPKIRKIVINEMEPADRCRLTRCSKKCSKEAKASRNYIYGLKILFVRDDYEIELIHGNNENDGYILKFTGRSERKFRRYLNQRHERLWETELDSDRDVAQLAFEEFKNILQTYQKSIKKLTLFCIPPLTFKNRQTFDFGIARLDNLEHLSVFGYVAVRKILSKLRKPLKTLNTMPNSGISDYKPIYQVQESLTWIGAEFDNQQFLKLSAKRVEISMGKLTEKDIFSFIRSWQDGTIGKDIESYCWNRDNSDFNIHQFLKLLRISDSDGQRETLEIKHFKEDGKYARLCISESSIQFVVTQ